MAGLDLKNGCQRTAVCVLGVFDLPLSSSEDVAPFAVKFARGIMSA